MSMKRCEAERECECRGGLREREARSNPVIIKTTGEFPA